MDGQYDVAWSEMNDNQLVSTCGDGSVKLWDLQSPGFPLMSWEEFCDAMENEEVQIVGLLKQSCFNGKQGIVLKWDSDRQRHQVKLSGTGEIKMIKTANLRLMQETSCQ